MPDQVGVFVCCHSWVQWVREAVQSVLDQTVEADSTIIVQDGYDPMDFDAADEVGEYARHLGVGHVSFLRNQGISRVRNHGYRWALDHGVDWAVALDDDDVLNSRFVERMLQAAVSRPDIDIWYPNFTTFGDIDEFGKALEFSFDLLKQGNFIISTAFVRPRVWEGVKKANGTGFDEQLIKEGMRWEDYLFWLEAAALGFKFAAVGTGGLVRVRRHAGSGSEVANRTIKQWRQYVSEKMVRLYGVEMWPLS